MPLYKLKAKRAPKKISKKLILCWALTGYVYICKKTLKMKTHTLINIICAFCIMLFISCSDNDEGKDITVEPPVKQFLIKKITETIYYSDESETSVSNFAYENNVLKSVTTNIRYKSEFEYNGDKITKVNYFRDEIAVGSVMFYYNGDFLSYLFSKGNPDERTEYSYVGGILASEKEGYLEEGKYIVQREMLLSFNQAQNITQVTSKSTLTGPEIISEIKYFYDNKNNPMKFMNKYYRLVFVKEGFDGKSVNNITSESYSSSTNADVSYTNFEITYNADDFPIEIKKISKSNNSVISKTLIEYQSI